MPSMPVARKQHAIVGAEQAALVHGGELDPVGIGVERIFDLRRVDADIVVVIGAPERMHAVGTQRHVVGGVRSRTAQRRLERHRPALDARLVADLDVPARHAGIAAHGAPILLGGLVILQHGLDHEGREIARLGVGAAAQAGEIIVGNFDRGLGHQLFGGALERWRAGSLLAPRYSARSLIACSSVSPGRTWVNSTGSSVMCKPAGSLPRDSEASRSARAPGSGKSARKCAPREFSRRKRGERDHPARPRPASAG